MRKSAIAIPLGLIFTLLPSAPLHAVYGGSEVKGSQLVLTLLTSKSSRTSFCSMSMLTERIVVTAAHCVIKDQGAAPELRWSISDIYVSQPGADVTRDDIETRVRVLKVVTRDDFINTWKPEVNDRRTQINDIAFLFLEKPLVKGYSIPIATDAEINAAIARADLVTHYGYGLQTQNTQSHSPWTTQMPLVDRSDTHLDKSKVLYTREGPTAMCPGDSGGPLYINVGGVQKIAGVLVAASGCRGNPPYNGGTLGTRVAPYMEMADAAWKKFLADEVALTKTAESTTSGINEKRIEAIANGTYLAAGNCHAKGMNAEVQIQDATGQWNLLAPTIGWIPSVSTCPSTHPIEPWTIINVDNSATLRWRFWTSAWNLYGSIFKWNGTVNTPIRPTSVIMGPKPEETTKKTFSAKKVTITCSKGVLSKKISGVSPKCPTGWKIKK